MVGGVPVAGMCVKSIAKRFFIGTPRPVQLTFIRLRAGGPYAGASVESAGAFAVASAARRAADELAETTHAARTAQGVAMAAVGHVEAVRAEFGALLELLERRTWAAQHRQRPAANTVYVHAGAGAPPFSSPVTTAAAMKEASAIEADGSPDVGPVCAGDGSAAGVGAAPTSSLQRRSSAVLANCLAAMDQCHELDRFHHRSVYRKAVTLCDLAHGGGKLNSAGSDVGGDFGGLPAARRALAKLFNKRRPQVVGVWKLDHAAGFESLDQRQHKYNRLRGKAGFVSALGVYWRNARRVAYLSRLFSVYFGLLSPVHRPIHPPARRPALA